MASTSVFLKPLPHVCVCVHVRVCISELQQRSVYNLLRDLASDSLGQTCRLRAPVLTAEGAPWFRQ